MSYKIGNLRALAEKVIADAEREGNEAEHYLGIKLVNLAREEGVREDDIVAAICEPKGER